MIRRVPTLVTITGPIAGGKNTVASALADLLKRDGSSVVIADVDDVAAMVQGQGAGALGLWFAAHEAHGALVARWMRSSVDVVIAVGPVYSAEEQSALFDPIPQGALVVRVIVDADVEVTWARVTADPTRGLSREEEFHHSAHARYRSLLPAVPYDLRFDSGATGAAEIAASIAATLSEPAGFGPTAANPLA